ncbi:ankyrin repeat domain-containing protein [Aquimarina litoralis]|uniref:ankyrin repeat domain-containing protein n=1 Tax=Aquimarina litoralis TaxID=584605 RepID=UPI001C57E765|nr:ankyrin repeat domain-containing protein [Aquimarina litoralis]MBW1295477.1 hypothetical protein [Aquimarina litoralis]
MEKEGFSIDQSIIEDAIDYFKSENDFSHLEKLLTQGLDINNRIDEWGVIEIPIWFLLLDELKTKEEISKIINLPGIDINAIDSKNNTFLHRLERYIPFKRSVAHKDEHMLSILNLFNEKGCDFFKLNEKGENVLFELVKYPKVAKFLLEQKCDPNQANRKGITPFMKACSSMKTMNDLNIWVEYDADVNKEVDHKDSRYNGWTPLFFAIENQNKEVVKGLLLSGIDLDHVSRDGDTAITLALDYRSEEILELLKDRIENPFNSSKVIEKMIAFQLYTSNWSDVIEWAAKIDTNAIEYSNTLNHISTAYRKLGDQEHTVLYTEKYIEQFGFDHNIWDTLIINYIIFGLDQQVVEYWEEHMDTFQPDKDPAANILAHMIVAYDRIGQHQKAIDIIVPFIDKAKNTKISKKGLLDFNIACMYAKADDVENTIKYGLQAVSKGYKKESFLDADFDIVRSNPLFDLFINYIDTQVLYKYLVHENANVTLYTRTSDVLEIIIFDGENYNAIQEKVDSSIELFKLFQEKISFYTNKGYSNSIPDFKKIWIPALDDLFQRIKKDTETPVGEIRIEWDFSYGDDLKANPMERPYYCYTDNGFDIDYYDEFLYIPLEKYHHEVLSEAIKLASFEELLKGDTLKIIQSEHDAGDEFIFEWEQ